MFKRTLVVAVGSLLLGLSFAASARGGGGGGGGGNFGSAAPGHASNQAMTNSNGSFASDRDKGQQRAEDRRSLEGSSHEKAQENRMHRNTKHAQKH
ncbi:hypothetical protein CupriaWKF_24580 [Cupriavidus sp. WKF15]|uniref:hypothetical protein n=1 Tax=Cupriavidus sp. WKF15 TaxID=3032282 RepID=UPI0023E2E814|nr:hypothetical protein [Cupriavidus sp. WKF15]WER47987.1 hypothetical protein CupriaWKF_24580 [Cupriavidus sp. WKF15]